MIAAAVTVGRNAVAIWQDLVEDHGFHSGYASVKRFVKKLRGSTPVEARVIITTAPGEEAQVDYGEGPMVRHPETGKYRRTRLFVMTLGYSRKAVRLLVWKSSAQIWAELHERAFRRLGGTVKVVVPPGLTGARGLVVTVNRAASAPSLVISKPVRLAVPVFVMVKVRLVLVPTTTEPKSLLPPLARLKPRGC